MKKPAVRRIITLLFVIFLAIISSVLIVLYWGLANSGSVSPTGTIGKVLAREQLYFHSSYYGCYGLIKTPESTWLIGQGTAKFPKEFAEYSIQNLDKFAKEDTPGINASPWLSTRPSEDWTVISQLNKQGKFEPIATISERVCLQTSPDGRQVFLLTSLDRPENSADELSAEQKKQTVVLYSDNQGKNWQQLKEGWFAPVSRYANRIVSHWYDNQQVWAIQRSMLSVDKVNFYSIFYSPDAGKSLQEIMLPENIKVSLPFVASQITAQAEYLQEEKIDASVYQLSDDRAVAWFPQRFFYALPGDPGLTQSYNILNYVELKRVNNQWVVGKIIRKPNQIAIEINQTSDNTFYAIMQWDAKTQQDHIVRLNPLNLEWEPVTTLPPSIFKLFAAPVKVRHFWVTDNVLIIHSLHEFVITKSNPLWWFVFKDTYLGHEMYHYSTDSGQTWHKLDLDKFWGMLGVSRSEDIIYGVKDAWKDVDIKFYAPLKHNNSD